MKKKGLIATIIIILVAILSYIAYFLISKHNFYSDINAVNDSLVVIKDDLPTKLYYTGFKLSGTLDKSQDEKANFIKVDEQFTFESDSNYYATFLIFNRIDFADENCDKYYTHLKGLNESNIHFSFYKCKNIDSFIRQYNYNTFNATMDYKSLIIMVRLSENSFKVINGNQSLSPNKYAKNDIIKGIGVALTNIYD